MAEHCIHDLDDSRLEPYRDLKKTNLTRWSGLFIAEGMRVVERLLESPYQVQSLLISQSDRDRFPEDLGEQYEVYTVEQSLAEMIVGYKFHAGVLAAAFRPERMEFAKWAASVAGEGIILGCPNTTDPDNLGTLIRISAAFGVKGILLGKGCADPYSRRVSRVSMGTVFSVPIFESSSFQYDVQTLQQADYQVMATVLGHQSIPLVHAPLPAKTLLLFGNESEGLDEELIALSDLRVTIPMAGKTDSLNVAVSAGIFLHHLTQPGRDL